MAETLYKEPNGSLKPLNNAINNLSNHSNQSTPSLSSVTLTEKQKQTKDSSISHRIEVNKLVVELQKRLGPSNWDKYQQTISLYLLGKLSKLEFNDTLTPLLSDSKLLRLHNQLLLANLANSLRDGPDMTISGKSTFGGSSSNKRKKDSKVKVSSQYEKLKKNIMNLPIRERYRIKTITRDSGKRNMSTSSMTLTRQALLPKIPYITNTSDNDHSNITGNTVEWTQDISHSLQTPLCTENFSLPDNESLESRMLGIAREHGLTGTIDKSVHELVSLGLETYLKFLLGGMIDTVRYRKRKYDGGDFVNTAEDGILDPSGMINTEVNLSNRIPVVSNQPGDISSTASNSKKKRKVTLTIEDVLDSVTISPYLMDYAGPVLRLASVMLNDDCYVEEKTPIDAFVNDEIKNAKVRAVPRILNKKVGGTSPVTTKSSVNTSTGTATYSQQSTAATGAAAVEDGNVEENSAQDKEERDQDNQPDGKIREEEGEEVNVKKEEVFGTREELNSLIYDILKAK